MIKSKTQKLLIALIFICICGAVLSAEPNKTLTEFKFDIKQGLPQPRHLLPTPKAQSIYSHYAVLFVRGDWTIYNRSIPIEAILETSAGQSMSKRQRELISNETIWYLDRGLTISNYTYFQLFGISEDDTKKMVNAFIEILADRGNKDMQHFLSKQQKYQKEIDDIKKKLPEKQKIYDEAKSKYEEIKIARYFSSLDDGEVYTKAKDTMFQMDKTLDTLEIELAGIQEKLKSIEKYRRNKYAEDAKKFSPETLDKLDQMYVEQLIELKSAKVRQQTALEIREREKEFLTLFSQWGNLESEVTGLKQDLEISENNLHDVEKKLANPTPEMLPPKVFQNKVTIYPVN